MTIHNKSKSPEFKVWASMKSRCKDRREHIWRNYGARGIGVCERWNNSFKNFLADMGERPTPKHTLDRIDSNRNYEPDNCRWATMLEQQNNRSNNLIVEYRGQKMTIGDAVRLAGSIVGRGTASSRIRNYGWSVTDAIEKPLVRPWRVELTNEQLRTIREGKESLRAAGKRFGVSSITIRRIRKGDPSRKDRVWERALV